MDELAPDELTANLLGALALVASDQIASATAGNLGLGGAAAGAVVSIVNHPGETVEHLRRALRLTHSGAVRLVDTLAKEKLVERQRSQQDARAITLWPTPDGQQKAASIIAARHAALSPLLNPLGSDDRKALERLLRKILADVTDGKDRARQICRLCDEKNCRVNHCPVEQAAFPP